MRVPEIPIEGDSFSRQVAQIITAQLIQATRIRSQHANMATDFDSQKGSLTEEEKQRRHETSLGALKKQVPPIFMQASALAHKVLDGLSGLEIGASAHNAFGLNTKNVGLTADMDFYDFEFYKHYQISMCGTWAPIDVPGHADKIPVADSSQDFVLNSHVWEHLPNPLGALEEWVRVVRHEGYIYAIVPKRDAEPTDIGRPVTSIDEHIQHWLLQSTHEKRSMIDAMPVRGHYSVFDPQSLLDIEVWYNLNHERSFEKLIR